MCRLKYILFLIILSLSSLIILAKNIYLIPGQGSDYRIFSKLELPDEYSVKNIKCYTPKEGSTMYSYAKKLSLQIDTTESFILIGVSLGGMIATEMTGFLSPEKTIIISSAKSKYELPHRYRFQNIIPVYKLMAGKVSKKSSFFMQPLVEPDRKKEKDIFVNMLKDKDPDFLERTIQMIMTWDRETYSDKIIHIHGDNDHTIPHKNIKYNYLIKDGSHMMTLTRAEEISTIIQRIL